MGKSAPDLSNLTENILNEAIKLRDFKAQATEGFIAYKIKSIILPLLADHVLGKSNHYINLLRSFSNT